MAYAHRSNMAARLGGTFRDVCISDRRMTNTMPTAKPRLQITIDDDTRATLDRLSRLQGRPASKIVTEILEEARPVLEQISDTLQAIQEASQAVKGTIRRRLGQAERRAYAAAVEGISVLAELEHDARTIASEPGQGASRSVGPVRPPTPLPPNPRPSNTGVTPPSLGKKGPTIDLAAARRQALQARRKKRR